MKRRNQTTERWIPLPGYEELIRISDQGGVYIKPGTPTKIVYLWKAHYWKVVIYKRPTYLHRLVARLFIPNPENHRIVNHLNGDKFDNRVDNLEWCNSSQNNGHAMRTGLIPNRGEKNSKHRLTDRAVLEIRRLRGEHPELSMKKLGKRFNVGDSTINAVLKRKTWTHI